MDASTGPRAASTTPTQPKVVNTGTFQLSTVRQYYKLTPVQKGDKWCTTSTALNGPVQVGDTLAVRITVGGNEWRYLMIEDPIPSGTESIARDDLYQLDEQPTWWTRWRSDRELRDDRTTFFNHLLPARAARIRLPAESGESRHLPRKPDPREPMYQPEYLSTSDASTVTVK